MFFTWKSLQNKGFTKKTKQILFILMNSILSGLLGFILWLVIRPFYLDSILYLLCFIGYPVMFIGFYGSILYLFRKNYA